MPQRVAVTVTASDQLATKVNAQLFYFGTRLTGQACAVKLCLPRADLMRNKGTADIFGCSINMQNAVGAYNMKQVMGTH